MTAPLTIRLHPADNVVVARMDILPGTAVEGEVAAATRVPPGHKILTRAVKKGEPLRKYNQIIGFAAEDLAAGAHIHTHNCVMGDFERDYAFCADSRPTEYITPAATFMGYRRADGNARQGVRGRSSPRRREFLLQRKRGDRGSWRRPDHHVLPPQSNWREDRRSPEAR